MLMKTQSAAGQAPTLAEAGDAVTELRRRYMTREPADKRLLEIHVYPRLGNIRVTDIEASHIVEVLEAVRRRTPKSVPRVRQCIARVLDWSVGLGLRPDNPCSPALNGFIGHRVARREPHAALPYAQVPDAVAAARSATQWIATRLLFECMVLTATRPGDARHARWEEIDVEHATWTVPSERTRKRRKHRVPLSTAALTVVLEARDHPELQESRRSGGDSDLVFPSKRGRLLSPSALHKMLNHLRIDATPYGFRRSFAEWVSATGVSIGIIRACLGFAEGDQMIRAIRGWDLYYRERVPVMERWGRRVAPDRSAPA